MKKPPSHAGLKRDRLFRQPKSPPIRMDVLPREFAAALLLLRNLNFRASSL